MNKWMEEQYEALGISREVYEFGEKIEDSLKERFAAIDATAEYNQLKVIKACVPQVICGRTKASSPLKQDAYTFSNVSRPRSL